MTTEVTALLRRWREGDSQALDRLVPLVYPELRRLARRFLQRERPDHTLAPTALVHEAYLRLADKDRPKWQDRIHFYAVAAKLMRRVLVDHARSRATVKRGGDVLLVPLDEARDQAEERTTDLLALDDALHRLEELDPRKSRIVELRYFGGLTLEETAQFLEISVPTVVKEARMARAWLYSQMSSAEETE